MERWIVVAATLSAATAVAAGAFGAHTLADAQSGRSAELFKTASQYQFGHAVAVLALQALQPESIVGPLLLLFASLVFATSLYGLGFGAPRWTGVITPLGGLAMIGGWLICAWKLRSVG